MEPAAGETTASDAYISDPYPAGPSTAPNRDVEVTRSRIAKYLLLILAFQIVFSSAFMVALGIFALRNNTPLLDVANVMKDVLAIIFGPVVALVGSATGFYFGSRERH